MNITIIGAGAMGGLFGTRLALAGETVSAVGVRQKSYRATTWIDAGPLMPL